jgi:branched-chain amino acid transport system substrate-binding protein
VLFLEWDFGNLDYGPIAARIKEAKPDFLWVGAIGLEGNQLLEAMSKIDYAPREHFYMYPAPGPMSKSPLARNALSMTVFEEHKPFLDHAGASDFIRLYHERAAKAGIPDTSVEVQAAASYTAWQILEAGVKGANGTDDKKIAEWLKKNQVDSIQGKLRFNGQNNYGDDLMKVKQVQGGHWKVVWPTQFAAPGAKLTFK